MGAAFFMAAEQQKPIKTVTLFDLTRCKQLSLPTEKVDAKGFLSGML